MCLLDEGRDFGRSRVGSKSLLGEYDGGSGDFEERGSSMDVFLVGEHGMPVGKVLKKLPAKAGFSRIIRRNRKSSFLLRGLPGRRKSTSLVLIKERNKL